MTDAEKQAKWDKRFMDLCDHISQWTEDRDFKVGAVIVGPDQEIRSTGYNGFPRGVRTDFEDRYNRSSGEKFFWFEHGERNAIYNAARIGVSTNGCTLYVNRFPCSDCARAIIQAGVSRVVCPHKPLNDGALDHSFDASETMLSEAAMNISHYTTNE